MRLPDRIGRAYTGLMTRSLNAAVTKLAELPADEQDRFATWLLDELHDEEEWAAEFRASRDALATLAAEARADDLAGRTTDLDPDNL